MNEQLLLGKWQNLNIDEQGKVLAFIDSISVEKQQEKLYKKTENDYQPKTELGKKLWQIRQKIVANPNIKLLELDEINAELDEMRRKS